MLLYLSFDSLLSTFSKKKMETEKWPNAADFPLLQIAHDCVKDKGDYYIDRYIFIPLYGVFGRLHFFTFYSPYIPNFDSI